MSSFDPIPLCEDCKWWEHEKEGFGPCLYEPPKVFAIYNPVSQEIEERTCFPTTNAGEFCSKFTPKTAATPTPTP